MNGEQRRRLALLEARLRGGVSSHVDALVDRDPETLTDQECVEVWRILAKRPCPPPEPFSPAEEAAFLEEWRRLRRSSGLG
jgi:hypothetical protein